MRLSVVPFTVNGVAVRWRAWLTDPRVHDAGLVLGCLFLTVLAVKGRWASLPWPVALTAGAVGSLAQWWRRHRPAVAVVLGALSGNLGAWLVGVYSGAAYARRGAWLGLAAGFPGLLAILWLDAGRPQVVDVIGAAATTLAVAGTGLYLR